MITLTPQLDRIRTALHPLDAQPAGACWNIAELAGLLPSGDPALAAVLVGLVLRSFGLQVLLTRRTDALRHHSGQVSFPGGRIEPDDADARAAAVRETGEEIGVESRLILPLGYLDPLATVTGFRVLPLVAVIAQDYVLRPDPHEVAEVFEVPFDYLMTPGNLQRISVEIGGRPRSVLQFAGNGNPARRIWGASASILLNLRQRLEASR